MLAGGVRERRGLPLDTPRKVDIAFLDIRMGGMDGIELAERLRESATRPAVVFVTTSREYALDAYRTHPFDYLVKPYTQEEMRRVLADVLDELTTREPTVEVGVPYGTVPVELGAIVFAQAQAHHTVFSLANGEKLRSTTMYAIVIAAPWETENPLNVLLPQSGAVALGMAAVLAALFARTLVVKLPALLAHTAIDGMWPWLSVTPMALSLLICWIIPWDLSLMLLGRARVIMLAMTALIPVVIWLFYDIAWRVMSRVAEAARLRQEVTVLDMEERRFRDLQTYVSETRALRHDFRHHLLAMRGMLEEGKTDELTAYMGQLTDAEELGQRPRLCDNAAIDAVAAHYDAAARDRGVRVSWNLALPEALPVPEVDLCSILGNLVENALNATASLTDGKRWIEVVSEEVTPSALGVVVRNPCEGLVVFGDDGIPVASEPSHGIGLASVAATAERYHGGVDAHVEDGVFSCGVVLYHE